MSLLNDILRDLSQQNPLSTTNQSYDESLLGSASFSQKKHIPWGSLAAVFIVVFVLVLAINYSFHKFIFNAQTRNIPSNISAKDAAENIKKEATIPTIPAQQKVPSVQADNSGQTRDEESRSIAKNSDLENHINDLLQQAARALTMDRLTAPIEDNAYGYYQKILNMDASNDSAREGLDEIAKRYLNKAQEQFAMGNAQAAEAFIQRARFVSERYVIAHEINREENVAVDNTYLTSDVIEKVSSPTKEIQPQHQPESPTETIKPFNVTELKNLSVEPSATWKDEQLVQHAQTLIKQNRQNEAQLALKSFIATGQKPVLSTAMLADIYIQQGNHEAAAIIAEQANYLPLDLKSKIKAQVLSAEGKNSQAIDVLEKNLIAADDNEDYRSLLASLYHKTGNYQQSIISYQRLINRFGEKPAYWLGLALAYDGLSQYNNALQAYQRLREFPQLQEQVTQYTDQRIAALRSE